MKSFDAIYKFGHLYDRVTKKRILIEQDAEVSVVIQDENILEKDESIAQKELPLSDEAKKAELERKYTDKTPYWLLCERGTPLYFEISGYTPKRKGRERFHLEFKMELLEDLYLYNKGKNPEKAPLCECKCVISECLTSSFPYFEQVYGDTLNKARTKLHQLYFSRLVNPASNAFREFHLDRNFNSSTKNNLEQLRLKVQKKPSINRK